MADNAVGTAGWIDLTVPDAKAVRAFYEEVVGWRSDGHDMGEYEDFNMYAPNAAQPTTGICHARGPNAGLPPVWLVYFIVADIEASVAACRASGGEVLQDRRSKTGGVAVIRDPAGAVCALYQP